MIALDTSVLARYLLADDRKQFATAHRLLQDPDAEFWVPATVLLELAWVLRSAGVPRAVIGSKVRELIALPGVRVQLPERVAQALHWTDGGLDFADAVHLALSAEATRFATFDQDFVARAGAMGTRPPVAQL